MQKYKTNLVEDDKVGLVLMVIAISYTSQAAGFYKYKQLQIMVINFLSKDV